MKEMPKEISEGLDLLQVKPLPITEEPLQAPPGLNYSPDQDRDTIGRFKDMGMGAKAVKRWAKRGVKDAVALEVRRATRGMTKAAIAKMKEVVKTAVLGAIVKAQEPEHLPFPPTKKAVSRKKAAGR